MSNEGKKPAKVLDVSLPDNYRDLKKNEKCKVESGIISRFNDTIVKAYSVAGNNLLSATQRQAEAFTYADMIKEGLMSLVPQVVDYIKNADSSEVEYETEGESEKGSYSSAKILKGQIRRKHIFLESCSRIAEKHAKLIKDLGTAPGMPGEKGPLFKQEVYNYGNTDPQADWEAHKAAAMDADDSSEE